MSYEEIQNITETVNSKIVAGINISINEKNSRPKAIITTWIKANDREETTILLLVKDFEEAAEFIDCRLDFALLPARWSIRYGRRH